MFGNKEATDAAFAERQARRQAPRREQPAVAGLDGAARRHRRLQRRDRRDHALRRPPESARRAHGAVAHLPRAGEPHPRGVARRRRRLRPQGRLLPRGRPGRLGGAQAAPPGEVGLDPQRSHAQRSSRPRDGLLRRARARRARQDSRAALEVAVPDGRLFRRRGARRRRLLDPLRAGRLRHPDHAHHVAGRVHQHLAERAVSRRRPPGGRLLHGAADRARRQRHRHRPRRNPPAQSHPGKQAALHHADALGLRLRRVRPPDGPVHGEQRLEGLRRAPARIEEERQAARPRRCASTSSSAASSTTAWT